MYMCFSGDFFLSVCLSTFVLKVSVVFEGVRNNEEAGTDEAC